MKSIIILGIIFCLIVSSLCDDCSSKTTESACTGSCKWTAGTSATCTAKKTCSLNSEGSACVSDDGCEFNEAEEEEAACTLSVTCNAQATTASDCATGCTFDDSKEAGQKCSAPTCELNSAKTACESSTGCTYTAASTTAASCTATATCELNDGKTACTNTDDCTFTAAVAGTCADSSNFIKMSFISLFFLLLF